MSNTPYFDDYEKNKNLKKNNFIVTLNSDQIFSQLRLKKDFITDINGNRYIKDVNLEYKCPTGRWINVLTLDS